MLKKIPYTKTALQTCYWFSEDAKEYAQHESEILKTLLYFTSHVFHTNEATNN